MKLKAFLAAALVFAAGASPVVLAAPAEAQTRTVVTERTVVRRDAPRYANQRYNSGRRYDNRRGYNNRRRYTNRQVCRNQYRNGRRVQVCRTVRR